MVNDTDEYEFELVAPGLLPSDFEFKNDTLIAGFTYRLVSIDPNPRVNGGQKLEDYKVSVSIENN